MEDHKRQLIALFLKQLRVAAKESFVYIGRPENDRTLEALSLTKHTCLDEILSLSVENYCRGPELDASGNGTVWVFGKAIEGQEVYIKVKIEEYGEKKRAKCISFHFAKQPLFFPMLQVCKEE